MLVYKLEKCSMEKRGFSWKKKESNEMCWLHLDEVSAKTDPFSMNIKRKTSLKRRGGKTRERRLGRL